MNLTNVLNFKRLGLHIKKEIYKNYRSWLIALGAVTGVLMVIDLLPGLISGNPAIPKGAFYTIFIIMGLFYSSRAFSEIHEEESGLRYLTTPGSELERLLSKIAITNILYIIIGIIYFYLVNYLLKGINIFFFDQAGGDFVFKQRVAKNYFILQSIFLFSSIYFKKFQTVKLLFSGFLIFIVLTIYSIINTRILFGTMNFNGLEGGVSFGKYPEYFQEIFQTVKFIYFWLIAPFFWLLTYLRLREQEV